MKICIITPSVIIGDGQGRANFEIAQEALRRNHHVTLVSNKVDSGLQSHKQVQWISFPNKKSPSQLLRGMNFSRQSALWISQHRHEFDIVQSYGAVTSAAGDINTAQFVHSAWLQSPAHTSRMRHDLYGVYQWLYTSLNARWERKAFGQAKIIIAVSERIGKEIAELGIPKEKIQVILNGVDLQEFSPGCSERNKIGLPEDVPLALFAGDIRTNRKNLDTVLKALTEVPEIHLAVVGGTTGSPYPKLAEKLGIKERVYFLGYRQDLPKIMRSVDFFVFPSRYEPFGMVVTEAMASGLPVITSSATGAAEVVTPESGIVLADPEDVDKLAHALLHLIKNSDLRKKMGSAARQIAEQHSWRSKAEMYLDLFEEQVR